MRNGRGLAGVQELHACGAGVWRHSHERQLLLWMQQRLALQVHALPGQLQATGRKVLQATRAGRSPLAASSTMPSRRSQVSSLRSCRPKTFWGNVLFSMVHRRRWDQRCSLLVNLACSVYVPGRAKHCDSSLGGSSAQLHCPAVCSASAPLGSPSHRPAAHRATSWRSTCGQ